MIKAKFLVLDSGKNIGFEIAGHSGYSESGTDIVCAAVSSAIYMAVTTITDIKQVEANINIDEKSGYMRAVFDENQYFKYEDILLGLKNHLLLLEENYSKNLQVSYLEV